MRISRLAGKLGGFSRAQCMQFHPPDLGQLRVSLGRTASELTTRKALGLAHGCGSKPMGSHFGVGAPPILEGGDWGVHRGYDLDFDSWHPCWSLL